MTDSVVMRIAYRAEGVKPKDIFLDCLTELFYNEKINENTKVDNIRKQLKKIYGLNIPDIVLNKWIKSKYRMDSDSNIYLPIYLNKNSKDEKKITLRDVEKNVENNEKKRDDFIKNSDFLRKKFIEYSFKEYKRKISKEDAKSILSDYQFLDNYDSNSPEGSLSKNKRIFQFFIKDHKDEDKVIKILENLGVANQLTQIVLGEDIDNDDFLRNCRFYLDTPILMRFFGYDGKEIATSYSEAIDALRELGAELFAFEHTFEEMWGILFSWKKNIALKRFSGNGVMAFLKARKEYGEECLPLEKEKVKEKFLEYKINIISKPDQTNEEDQKFVIDENGLEKELKEFIHWKSFPDRITKDLFSISSILFLRNKESIENPETYRDAKYFFLTDNIAIVRAVKRFMKSQKDYDPKKYAKLPVELLDSLSVFVWQNSQNHDKLMRSLFRAKCFSHINMPDDFRRKLHERISHLNSEKYDELMTLVVSYPEYEEILYRDYVNNENSFDYNEVLNKYRSLNELQKEKERTSQEKEFEKKLKEREEKMKKEMEEKIENIKEEIKEEEERRSKLRRQEEKKFSYRMHAFFSHEKAQIKLNAKIKKAMEKGM